MNATAISNNDMVYLHWQFNGKIPDCLGFSVIRHDAQTNAKEALPAMVGFPSDKQGGHKFKTTDEWPVQKFAWKDLFAKRGGTYWYEIVPMIGKPGSLQPDLQKAMRTNSVTLKPEHGDCSVFFNRGIISTQAIASSLPKTSDGRPNSAKLRAAIDDPNNPIRKRLIGDLEQGVLTLVERAQQEGGECYCALYELADKDLIEHLEALANNAHVVLSNAGEDTEEGNGDGDSTNKDARIALRKKDVDLDDRMLKKGHIGHNKFVVYVKNGPQAVLTGSTNWTPTGLCAQSNNAILIKSAAIAKQYFDYWKRLKDDTEDAAGDRAALQGTKFRSDNKEKTDASEITGADGQPSGTMHPWFSPNTKQKSVPRSKKGTSGKTPQTPPDLAEVFDLIQNAKQGALFLAFIPGSPSIVSKLKEVYDSRRKDKKLFYLRGAATSPDPATIFRVDLYHRSSKVDASLPVGLGSPQTSAFVASVAGMFDAFGAWETEIYKLGHAVIHDKILVIDPFTDDSVVITGSHNLGFKASYANDENMVIIRENRPVAYAYAAHVLDVYEHYRWRWRLQQPLIDAVAKLKKVRPKAKAADLWKEVLETTGPKVAKEAWKNLTPNDSWQDFYQKNRGFLAAEENFWSAFGGVGYAEGKFADPARG